MALTGKVARIRYTSASATSSTNNAATLSTDGVTLQIDSTARRHWNPANSTSVKVFVSGSTGTANTDSRTVNYVQGIVTFATAHSTAATYTIDTEYFTATYMTGGRNWSVDVDNDMLDVTTYSTSTADTKWRVFKPGLSQATVNIGRIVPSSSTGPLAYDRLNAETRILTELVQDSGSSGRWEGYGWITRDSLGDDIDDLATEGIDIRIDGELYWTT